ALLRPKHWVKNGFVFAPLLFSGHFRSVQEVLQVMGSFAVFCLAASAVYVANDIVDRERDANSPTNRQRPGVRTCGESLRSAARAREHGGRLGVRPQARPGDAPLSRQQPRLYPL